MYKDNWCHRCFEERPVYPSRHPTHCARCWFNNHCVVSANCVGNEVVGGVCLSCREQHKAKPNQCLHPYRHLSSKPLVPGAVYPKHYPVLCQDCFLSESMRWFDGTTILRCATCATFLSQFPGKEARLKDCWLCQETKTQKSPESVVEQNNITKMDQEDLCDPCFEEPPDYAKIDKENSCDSCGKEPPVVAEYCMQCFEERPIYAKHCARCYVNSHCVVSISCNPAKVVGGICMTCREEHKAKPNQCLHPYRHINKKVPGAVYPEECPVLCEVCFLKSMKSVDDSTLLRCATCATFLSQLPGKQASLKDCSLCQETKTRKRRALETASAFILMLMNTCEPSV